MKSYHVYIMASRSGVLYVGVTGNLEQRLTTHRERSVPGFASKYRIDKLVYAEETHDITAAIAREKEIKKWGRKKKIELIRSANPEFVDLQSGN